MSIAAKTQYPARTCSAVCVAALATIMTLVLPALAHAHLSDGQMITQSNDESVADLVSPGNFVMVKQGMTMKIVPTGNLEWPAPYRAATEKYSPQVRLSPNGELTSYVAGLPFPMLDANDPQVALKIMWNFSLRPQYTDDVDIRDVEAESHAADPRASDSIEHFTIGHFALYNNIDRTEVAPMPTDPDAIASGIRYRFAVYPILEPSELRGIGFLRYRHLDPNREDSSWIYQPISRRTRRIAANALSDTIEGIGASDSAGASLTYANTVDPDSYFGFAAKIEDYDYKLLGVRRMLACVEAANSPAHECPVDGGRSVCPENWETRYLYVIEATAKKSSQLGSPPPVPHRIFYIDSEGFFITASDLYDRDGQLWKTIATFNAYRDRPTPDAKVSIWKYKRMFQTALVDEDVRSGLSTVLYTPSRDSDFADSWFINQGAIGPSLLVPEAIVRLGH
jgi:Protein of unknown function (DUF1329)